MMKDHDEQLQKWEYIGHRLMQSSDLQVLCGVTRTTPGAEKPFVAGLSDDELKGMITFVLERMREIDEHLTLRTEQQVSKIPYEYRDRQQEYLRLQVPKSEHHRSSDLYNADFINDLDEGYDTFQGVFVTLSRALFYLFEEVHYRHGGIDDVFMQVLQQTFSEYADIIEQTAPNREHSPASTAHQSSIKLNLTQERLAELLGCLEVFFDPSDRLALKKLLEGHPIDHKLVFNGNQNRFVEVFRRLSYNGFLHESWTNIRDWLCGHFSYRAKTGIAVLSQNSVWDILAKSKGEPTGRSRICFLDWLPYKTSASLKRNY